MTNSTLVSPVKIEYGWNFSIYGLNMMMKSGLGKIFLKFLHALTMSFLVLNFCQKYKQHWSEISKLCSLLKSFLFSDVFYLKGTNFPSSLMKFPLGPDKNKLHSWAKFKIIVVRKPEGKLYSFHAKILSKHNLWE